MSNNVINSIEMNVDNNEILDRFIVHLDDMQTININSSDIQHTSFTFTVIVVNGIYNFYNKLKSKKYLMKYEGTLIFPQGKMDSILLNYIYENGINNLITEKDKQFNVTQKELVRFMKRVNNCFSENEDIFLEMDDMFEAYHATMTCHLYVYKQEQNRIFNKCSIIYYVYSINNCMNYSGYIPTNNISIFNSYNSHNKLYQIKKVKTFLNVYKQDLINPFYCITGTLNKKNDIFTSIYDKRVATLVNCKKYTLQNILDMYFNQVEKYNVEDHRTYINDNIIANYNINNNNYNILLVEHNSNNITHTIYNDCFDKLKNLKRLLKQFNPTIIHHRLVFNSSTCETKWLDILKYSGHIIVIKDHNNMYFYE